MRRIAIRGATGYFGLALATVAVHRGFEVYSVNIRRTDANLRQRRLLERLGVKPHDSIEFSEKQPFKLLVVATTPYSGDVEDVNNLVSTGLFKNVVYLGSGAQMMSPEEIDAEIRKVAASKSSATPYSSYGLNKRRISLIPGVFTVHMGFLIPDIVVPVSNIGLQSATWSNLCEAVTLSQVKDPQRAYRISAVSNVVLWLLMIMQHDEWSPEDGPYGYPSTDVMSSYPWTRQRIWEATFKTSIENVYDQAIVIASKLHATVAKIDKLRDLALLGLQNSSTLSEEYMHGISHLQDVFDNAFIAYFDDESTSFSTEFPRDFVSEAHVVCLSALFHEYFDDKFARPEDMPQKERELLSHLQTVLCLDARDARAISLIAQSVSYRKRIANATPMQVEHLADMSVKRAWNIVNDADMLEAYDLRRTFAIVIKKNAENKSEPFFGVLGRDEVRKIVAQRAADHIDEKLKHLHGMMATDYGIARSRPLHAELMDKYQVLREIQAGSGALPELDEILDKFYGIKQ